MKEYDIVIVGAGPAGLAASKVLAQNNKKVLIIEKNQKIGPKVCAGGLTIKDFELGIPKDIAQRTFNEVFLYTPLTKNKIDDNKPFVTTVNREELGQFMQKEAEKSGVEIITGTEVISINENSIKTTNDEYGFQYLIGADGSLSLVRKFLKLKTSENMIAFHYKVPGNFPNMELYFDANLFGSGYAWIFPHREWASIGCCADPHSLVTGIQLKKNFEKWLLEKNINVSQATHEAWNINYDYKGYDFGNIFLIGDAGGFSSGLTGEGMYYAMVSGIEIAKKILNPNYDTPKITEILKQKEKHEKVLSMIDFNKTLSQIEYDTLGLFIKTRLLNRTLIDSFA